ncbi:Multiprotein-bridging factor 1c [Galdieria sulphuraria]|uniref:Putative transcription factor n=1 Tax=Galdieria sulphuraria TaxID=130081 RepID=M2XMX6_GALSU|nr:putative transcription factor [Galdieria sulphuraria]EME31547.1 putative transcription factor [Galdieria sulphuraria]GJD10199.1 Multiprotein-bridging factor 1c [Galdieria sulphuraria]|eukprot:XP_005708067.1 putative transcription factor [Galdieria sulphuraria]
MDDSSFQDWTPVIVNKRSSNRKKPAAGPVSSQNSGEVIVEKKFGVGTNKKATGRNLAKLEEETEEFHLPKVSLSLAKQIQQARNAKKMTQSDLAKAVNEKASVINQYERGEAIPEVSVLAKLEKVLGVKLRGKK